MNEYELYHAVRQQLETVWRAAERRARWLASVDMQSDGDAEYSRATGGKV